jgi:hypothetical protein
VVEASETVSRRERASSIWCRRETRVSERSASYARTHDMTKELEKC